MILGNFVFIADEAFALKTWLMRPFPGRGMTNEKRIFNYRLSRARRTIENAFGILVQRFQILKHHLEMDPKNAVTITMACCVLHNMLRGWKVAENEVVAAPQDGAIQPVEQNIAQRNPTAAATAVRELLCRYFLDEGAIIQQQAIVHPEL